MFKFEYTLNDQNQIINFKNEVINTPAIMFDRTTGTLHAHGEKSTVEAHYDKFKRADKTNVIIDTMTIFYWNMKRVQLDNVVEELNKLISISGYAKQFCLKNKL